MSALDRFKAMLDERVCAYNVVRDPFGSHVELQVFGHRMVVSNANPINDHTHTRLVAHIMCPRPDELMAMLDRMCGNMKED